MFSEEQINNIKKLNVLSTDMADSKAFINYDKFGKSIPITNSSANTTKSFNSSCLKISVSLRESEQNSGSLESKNMKSILP
jgi:hypothetical protein